MRIPFPAVLFDLDGTLIDGYPAIAASANAVRAGYGLPPLDVEAIRPYVGRGLEVLLEAITPTSDPARDAAVYREHYARTLFEGTHLLPGAARLLAELATSGRQLGVCSNKLARFTRQLLEHLGLAAHIGVVLGPELVERPKPAPDMLLAAAAVLGAAPAETLYVGDMSVDIEAGRAAGMTVWVVTTGSESPERLQAAGPDRIFDGLNGVRAAILTGIA